MRLLVLFLAVCAIVAATAVPWTDAQPYPPHPPPHPPHPPGGGTGGSFPPPPVTAPSPPPASPSPSPPPPHGSDDDDGSGLGDSDDVDGQTEGRSFTISVTTVLFFMLVVGLLCAALALLYRLRKRTHRVDAAAADHYGSDPSTRYSRQQFVGVGIVPDNQVGSSLLFPSGKYSYQTTDGNVVTTGVMQVSFADGRVLGSGNDVQGAFHIDGFYSDRTQRVAWIAVYETGTHVDYRGRANLHSPTVSIAGQWTIVSDYRGGTSTDVFQAHFIVASSAVPNHTLSFGSARAPSVLTAGGSHVDTDDALQNMPPPPLISTVIPPTPPSANSTSASPAPTTPPLPAPPTSPPAAHTRSSVELDVFASSADASPYDSPPPFSDLPPAFSASSDTSRPLLTLAPLTLPPLPSSATQRRAIPPAGPAPPPGSPPAASSSSRLDSPV